MKFRIKSVCCGLFIAVLALCVSSCRSVPEPRKLSPEEMVRRENAEAVFIPARAAYVSAPSDDARETALSEIRKAAVDVFPEAMYFYGFHYYSIKDQIPKERDLAVEWIGKAAEADYPPAMITMATFYMNGYGVFRSVSKAWKLFMRAAQSGDSFAMYNLGLIYLRGAGVRQDDGVAAEWFKKAADKGDVRSWVYLGNLYLRGKGVFKSYGKAERCFVRAAEKGDGEAMMLIGLMWKNGIGRDPDLIKAQEWLQKAVDAGYSPAKKRMDDIESSRNF